MRIFSTIEKKFNCTILLEARQNSIENLNFISIKENQKNPGFFYNIALLAEIIETFPTSEKNIFFSLLIPICIFQIVQLFLLFFQLKKNPRSISKLPKLVYVVASLLDLFTIYTKIWTEPSFLSSLTSFFFLLPVCFCTVMYACQKIFYPSDHKRAISIYRSLRLGSMISFVGFVAWRGLGSVFLFFPVNLLLMVIESFIFPIKDFQYISLLTLLLPKYILNWLVLFFMSYYKPGSRYRLVKKGIVTIIFSLPIICLILIQKTYGPRFGFYKFEEEKKNNIGSPFNSSSSEYLFEDYHEEDLKKEVCSICLTGFDLAKSIDSNSDFQKFYCKNLFY